MIGRVLGFALLLGAAVACSPQPRSASYFAAHADEAADVTKACAAGAHRGAECDTAQAGLAAAQRDVRMSDYRKAFEGK